jgi:NAD(P)-dependent dehydrogenase (short-subunit alcohol dehydrogenase family)
VSKALESIRAVWKKIDVLLLNHGWSTFGSFANATEDVLDIYEQIMFINFHSYVRMVHGLLPLIAPNGSIAVTGSLSGLGE